IIEFSHRLTSGIAVVSVLVLVVWAFRGFPRGYGVRGGALLALASTGTECAIGAALVLLRLVGSNESLARGLWLGAHLVNMLFLLAALSVTAWHATEVRERGFSRPILALSLSRNRAPRSAPAAISSRRVDAAASCALAGFLFAAVLGGFAALGDTLVVSTSLGASIHADFSVSSNIFVRLRVLHPIVAGALGIWLLVLAYKLCAVAKRLSIAVAALVLAQFALGIANIVLLTPIWLQLAHLLAADLLWIACVLLVLAQAGSRRRIVSADLQPASACPAPSARTLSSPTLPTPTPRPATTPSIPPSVTSMEGHALSVG
ncbi:MAG TPA: COX15/CtaA family protein, partial [Candidatus Acidoferrales bacterium]|nr:COX15/CtaA family protein [Candidatus Acidoferrales bacterium]